MAQKANWHPADAFPQNVFTLTVDNKNEEIEIDPGTLVPYWCGERMDYGMAVDGLSRRE